MSTNYATPGVYVNEISTLPPSVAGVSTAIPAFVGYVEKAERNGEGIPLFTPVRITSFLEYQSFFGGANPQKFEIEIMDDTTVTPPTRVVTVEKTSSVIPEPPFRMYYNLQMYFANGGGPCWIVPVGVYALASSVSSGALVDGLKALEKVSEPTLLVFPDAVSMDDTGIKEVYEKALEQCELMKSRFTIMDVKQGTGTPVNPVTDANDFRNTNIGIEYLKYGAAYYPDLNTTLNFGVSGLLLQVTKYQSGNPLTPPPPPGFNEVKSFNEDVSNAVQGTIDALNYLKIATTTLSEDDAESVETIVSTIRTNVNHAVTVYNSGAGLPVAFNNAGLKITAIATIGVPEPTPPDPVIDPGLLELAENAAAAFVDDHDSSSANALKLALQNLLAALNGVVTDITAGYNDPATNFIGGNLNYLQGNQPSVYNEILAAINGYRVTLNPSGAMAGIYARVDSIRGVWQAPANVGVRNVIGPAVLVTNQQQGELNVDSLSGKSINVIRNFTGRGTLVWGARTLDGNSNEWRYINVRRLFIYLEESIRRASAFVVFEPNDANTWVGVKGMIEAFLTGVWRDGGLTGATPQEAFFVNVGLGSTMTSTDVLEGRMIIEIGVAAVRPAEFIILRFVHVVQES